MTNEEHTSGWRSFWTRGGWWRLVLLAAAYMAIYLGAGWASGTVFADRIDASDLFGSAQSVLFGLTVPLLVGSIILAGFAYSVGWFGPLFASQSVRGSRWMWLAPIFVLAPVLLRFFGIDYTSYPGGVVAVTLLTGLLIGFAEELLSRGFAVKMLRDSGKSERSVMVLSSLLFALLHSTNILSGQAIVTVLLTMVFTFAFGICMYLTLRVTGNLIWPMIIHGLYDPTLFLASGGIDEAATGEQSTLLALAAPANLIYILLAIIALVVVRERVQRREAVLA